MDISEFLNKLPEIFDEISLLLEQITSASGSVTEMLMAAASLITVIIGLITALVTIITGVIASLGTGLTLLITVLAALGTFLIVAGIWFAQSFVVYKLAKKLKYKYAALAWIPIFGDIFRTIVLVMAVGDKPFQLFGGRITIKNRILTLIICVVMQYCGYTLITTLIAVLSIIPGLGQILGAITSLLYLVPYIVVAIMNYVYFRDLLDCFNEDKKSNVATSIVITLLDELVTQGLVRFVYYIILLFKDPLPQKTVEAVAVQAIEEV